MFINSYVKMVKEYCKLYVLDCGEQAVILKAEIEYGQSSGVERDFRHACGLSVGSWLNTTAQPLNEGLELVDIPNVADMGNGIFKIETTVGLPRQVVYDSVSKCGVITTTLEDERYLSCCGFERSNSERIALVVDALSTFMHVDDKIIELLSKGGLQYHDSLAPIIINGVEYQRDSDLIFKYNGQYYLKETHLVYDDTLYTKEEYNNIYSTCAVCGNVRRRDTLQEFDGDMICASCVPWAQHEYNYTPEYFLCHGKRVSDKALHMGVELEVELVELNRRDDTDCIRENLEMRKELYDKQGRIYFMNDGSLIDRDISTEIVSMPMTLNYHQKFGWKEKFEILDKYGYGASHRCGLHVHVNRSYFGDEQHQQEAIVKLVYLVDKYHRNLIHFCNRSEDSMDRWAQRYGARRGDSADAVKSRIDNNKDKYRAVNLMHKNSIEFRLFGGTSSYPEFMSRLKFVKHICNIAKNKSFEEVRELTWKEFIGASK